MEVKKGGPPAYYEELARDEMSKGNFLEARDLWMMAVGATIGHNRRQRYEEAAEECQRQFDLQNQDPIRTPFG